MSTVVLPSVATAAQLQRVTVSKVDYRPDIDGLRAIAVLSVVAGHSGLPLKGAWIGVDVFFVISGYLISGIILRALSREHFSLMNFYARRAKRLFPALILVLLVVWVVCWLLLLPDELQHLGRDVLTSSAYLQNFFVYFELREPILPRVTSYFLTHLWSLSVEEQFYFLWPLALIIGSRLRAILPALMLAITVTSFSLNLVATNSTDIWGAYLMPWNRLWELSLGGMLAHIELLCKKTADSSFPMKSGLRFDIAVIRYACHVIGVAGMTLLLSSIVAFDIENSLGVWQLVPTIGTCFLILSGPHGWMSRHVLSARPLVFIGLISYPLYLWHPPVLSIARIIYIEEFHSVTVKSTALLLSLALSILTYRYVELPLRSSASTYRVAALLSTIMVFCAGIGYLTFTQQLQPRSHSKKIDTYVRAMTEYSLPTPGDPFRTPVLENSPMVGNAKRRTLFIGDSTVKQYYPRIALLLSRSPRSRRSAVFAAWEECDPWVRRFPDRQVVCERLANDTIEYALSDAVDTVVISACWYCRFVGMDFENTDKDVALRSYTDKVLKDLMQVVIRLTAAGKRVYIVLDAPLDLALDPRYMIRRTISSQGFAVVERFVESRKVVNRLKPISSRLTRIAELSGANLIDPVDFLCDETRCPSTFGDGLPIHRDILNLRPSYVQSNVTFLDKTVMDAELVKPTLLRNAK